MVVANPNGVYVVMGNELDWLPKTCGKVRAIMKAWNDTVELVVEPIVDEEEDWEGSEWTALSNEEWCNLSDCTSSGTDVMGDE